MILTGDDINRGCCLLRDDINKSGTYLRRGIFVVGVSPVDGLGQMVDPHEPFCRGDVATHTL